MFTDGSVKRGEKSGWAFTARVNGSTTGEGSGAVDMTASSMAMEVKAATEALRFLSETSHRKAVIVTDSMSMLQKIKKGLFYTDWCPSQSAPDHHLAVLSWPLRSSGQ